MKPRYTSLLLLLSFLLLFAGCAKAPTGDEETETYTKEDYAIDMNTDFAACESLANGGGKAVKVVLLLGQSNASGCSIVKYLQENTDAETFSRYTAGFENVKINYCIDNQYHTSGGEFVPVDLTAGCGEGFFGPEVGLAEVLHEEAPDEEIFILKYTMSGYSLNHHWLYDGERAWIYDACMIFVDTYMTALAAHGYQASIAAILWMQGESDTNMYDAERYYDNQVKFVSYLREDLAAFADGEIAFIDAGISSSPYCEPGYPQVNAAKRRFADLSEHNIYFDTIDMGLTTLNEPYYEPDLGHYDSLSEIALGRRFGEELVRVCFGD